MMSVSVIIVSIGAKDYIFSCLSSLFAQSLAPQEIIIIDNSLQPDFSRKINSLYPLAKLYRSQENLFYGVALNKGISLSAGEFILCLNDDVILDKEFIREGLKGFSENKQIGSVSGKILRANGKILDSTGLFLTPWRSARERGYGRPDLGQFDKKGFVFGAGGAAAFYRRQMLDAVKEKGDYFDADFGMFYEDLDIAWRAQRRGWRAVYIPTARAFHVRGGSFRPDAAIDKPLARKYLSDQLHCELIKNRYLTILKNETFFNIVLHIIPICVYDFCAWAYVIFFRPRVIRICFSRFFARPGQNKRF
jgi:GT2 family glycosyltransferase